MTDEYEKKVSDYWSNMANQKPSMFNWSDSKLVLENINKLISGDANKGWLQYSCKKYLLKNGNGVDWGLSIGCGKGDLERQCLKMRACKKIDAIDIATGAIDEAKKIAEQQGISEIYYEAKNIEKTDLPKEKYDVVFSSSSIHHIKDLEGTFEKIQKSLKPNGLFILLEYVGPSQFQFSPKVVNIINEILNILPYHYKKSSKSEKFKESFDKSTVEYMNENDPSESIRSAEIIQTLSEYFTIIEKKDYGGTILHMLLQDILANFNHEDFRDIALLKILILLENILIREAVIPSDFAFIVARNVV